MTKLIQIFAICLSFLAVNTSTAAVIWGSDASTALTGTRTSAENAGVIGTGPWGEGGFSISWDISFDSNSGYWTYVYSIDTTSSSPTTAVAYLLLEVTDSNPFNIFAGTTYPLTGPQTWTPATGDEDGDNAIPGLPHNINAIRFDVAGNDEGMIDYTLVTDRAPVWGVFYAKEMMNSEQNIVAYANALEYSDYKTISILTELDYIVRPDGTTVIPIPATVWLLGSAVLGLLVTRKKPV